MEKGAHLYERWQNKYRCALDNTKDKASRPGVLIEVAAQHPLVDGELPGDEFRARLDKAFEIYQKLSKGVEDEWGDRSFDPIKIYVPGSLHKGDKISLSATGCAYLLGKGVRPIDLLGEKQNERFKPEGVYNSSDECFVATKLLERLKYGKFISVCSPAQLMRKALSYIEFGYVPEMISVPVEDMFHSYVEETFVNIPRLLEDGKGLQDNSVEGERLRNERKPKAS